MGVKQSEWLERGHAHARYLRGVAIDSCTRSFADRERTAVGLVTTEDAAAVAALCCAAVRPPKSIVRRRRPRGSSLARSLARYSLKLKACWAAFVRIQKGEGQVQCGRRRRRRRAKRRRAQCAENE